MNKKVIITLTIICLTLGIASPVWSIPLLEIVPGTPGSIPLKPDSHDVDDTRGAVGWYDADLKALENLLLTYEYLGKEAAWTNAFLVDDTPVFWNNTNSGVGATESSYGDTAASSASADDWLNFAFNILAGGNAGAGVQNGFNVSPTGTPSGIKDYGAPNFFLGYVDDTQTSVFIALDDGGGAPWYDESLDDDDHDDLVVKVTAVRVPEPSMMLLFGSSLIGLAAFRRKIRR